MLVISCKLRMILAERNKNRTWLSKKAGVNLVTIKPLYDDTWKRTDRAIINRIAKALEIPANSLFEDKPD